MGLNMDGTYFTDKYSVGVFGQTQTCKTSLVRMVHARTPRMSVWFNHADRKAPDIKGKTLQSASELPGAIQQGYRKFDLRVSPSRRDDELELLKDIMFRIADGAGNPPQQVVIDEAHNIAPEHGGGSPLHTLTKEGSGGNVKTILISQDPAGVAKGAARQAEYLVWCGYPNILMHEDYLTGMGLKVDRLSDLGRHEYTVIRNDGTIMCRKASPPSEYAT